MKKRLIIAGVILSSICIIFAVIFFTADIEVQTSTSGLLSASYHGYRYNSFFKIRLPYLISEEKIEKNSKLQEQKSAREYVLNNDSEFFDCNLCSTPESYVFAIENYIYYYHVDDHEHFYRINKDTAEIEIKDFSAYVQDIKGMHNFSVTNNITAEGLIDYYNMSSSIESIDGMFYEDDIYYSNGRVFFEKSDRLYEYVPSSQKVKSVGRVSKDENIENLWVKGK